MFYSQIFLLNHNYSLSIQVTSSNAMEAEGLRRGLAKVTGELSIDTLATDRHATVSLQ